jgi:hypothetical protein
MLEPKLETAGDETKRRLEQLHDVYSWLIVGMVKTGWGMAFREERGNVFEDLIGGCDRKGPP